MSIDDLHRLLGRYRLRHGTEAALQADVETLLEQEGVGFERERRLAGGPIDFLVTGGVGLECKVAGGPSEVLAQLLRYADQPEVAALLLVTSRHTHRFSIDTLREKPFRVLWVAGLL